MILRRDIAAALAFWLLVAGLVWLRVEIGPLGPRRNAGMEGAPPYATSALRTSRETDGARRSPFPDGR